MTLHRFSSAALPASAWKNGGGSTQEVLCVPPGSDYEHFHWRVSIARIDRSGPFSVFPGVDRIITLLSGDGVRLVSAAGGFDHRLDRPLQPFAFSGDVALDCTLLGGPSQDLNVMTWRGVARAAVGCLDGARNHRITAPSGLLLAVRGDGTVRTADGAGCTLQANNTDGVWWCDQGADFELELTTTDPAAQMIVVTVEPSPTTPAQHAGTAA